MKTILGALALVLAAPVAAQSGAPADAHADHARHEQQQQQQQGEGHEGHECCCEKMKQEGRTMECCDKHGDTSAGAQPSPTEQHNH